MLCMNFGFQLAEFIRYSQAKCIEIMFSKQYFSTRWAPHCLLPKIIKLFTLSHAGDDKTVLYIIAKLDLHVVDSVHCTIVCDYKSVAKLLLLHYYFVCVLRGLQHS